MCDALSGVVAHQPTNQPTACSCVWGPSGTTMRRLTAQLNVTEASRTVVLIDDVKGFQAGLETPLALHTYVHLNY